MKIVDVRKTKKYKITLLDKNNTIINETVLYMTEEERKHQTGIASPILKKLKQTLKVEEIK